MTRPANRAALLLALTLAVTLTLTTISLASCGGEPVTGTQTATTQAATTPTAAATPTGTHDVTIDGHALTLPDGIDINRWASGRGRLRMMALTGDGLLLVTEMDKGNVLAYRLAEENPQPITVVKGLSTPSGITVHEGYIYVAEETRVSRYPYNGNGSVGGRETIIEGLPSGGHETRTISVGPDNMLYLTAGSSCNVCIESDPRRAAMSRYSLDGTGGEIFASGLRNTVGFTWEPGTPDIWGTDNGRDYLGNDLPPDEINIIQRGINYGWPYCYGDRVDDTAFQEDNPKPGFCQETGQPAVELKAHSAPLGLRFLTEPGWPQSWQKNLFVAYHGSWNTTVPTGYKVVRIDSNHNVNDFITGWLLPDGNYWGRPVDIIFADNRMYISDDGSGSIYRVSL